MKLYSDICKSHPSIARLTRLLVKDLNGIRERALLSIRSIMGKMARQLWCDLKGVSHLIAKLRMKTMTIGALIGSKSNISRSTELL